MAARLDDPYGAFCKDSDAYLEGASEGPLAGLTFAAKDIFDIAGHVPFCTMESAISVFHAFNVHLGRLPIEFIGRVQVDQRKGTGKSA